MNAFKDNTPRNTSAGRQEKTAITDSEARKITAAEALARAKKTEKLRLLRLQQAASQAEAAPPPKSKKR